MKYSIAISTVVLALAACAPSKPPAQPAQQDPTPVSNAPPTDSRFPAPGQVGETQTTGAEMPVQTQPTPPMESMSPQPTPSGPAMSGVQPSATGPESAHDRTISTKVRNAIIYEPSLYGVGVGGIEIKTVLGKVTLKGKVPTAEDKAMVEKRAREVKGVTEVDDQIVITKK